MPPVVKTYLNLLDSSNTVKIIFFSISGITLTSPTDIPHFSFNHLEMKETFLSCVLPDKISLPIIKIAAFTFLFFSSY